MNPRLRSMVFPAIVTAVVAASVIAAIVVLGCPERSTSAQNGRDARAIISR